MGKRRMMWTVAGLIAVLLPVAGLAMLSLGANRPSNLGVTKGKLAACPDSPNCVSSQAAIDAQRVDPLPLPLQRASGEDGDVVAPMSIERLAALIAGLPGATVVRQTEDYLHAEFRSRIFRFVDDVELYVDEPAGVIQVRSASRVGHADFGANRRRVEVIREALAAASD